MLRTRPSFALRLSHRIALLSTWAVALSACAAHHEARCDLTPERRVITMQNISAAIAKLSTAEVTYDLKRTLDAQGNLFPVKGNLKGVSGVCWAELFPLSLTRGEILDGGGGLIIDPVTLEVVDHFFFDW
jgi:hypothetical protein